MRSLPAKNRFKAFLEKIWLPKEKKA